MKYTSIKKMESQWKFNPLLRRPVYSAGGMVATSQYLASAAGIEMLQKKGNAIDAILAMATTLTVVEPCSTSLGSDAFSIVYFGGKMYGLNSSGYSPRSITAEQVRRLGYHKMPVYGAIPVTVPGAVAAWIALHERFGKLPLTMVMEPAIRYAEEGYALTPVISRLWREAAEEFAANRNIPGIDTWFDTYMPKGSIPQEGDRIRLPFHAATLEKIARTKGKAFYQGEIAERIGDYMKKTGGFLSAEDFADYEPTWVEPICMEYRGHKLWELPPNGQGIVALMALNILKGFTFEEHNADAYHKQIEAIKLAFADAHAYLADPSCMQVSVRDLLSEEYGASRRALIRDESQIYMPGTPRGSDTVYLCAADQEGNMVSYIQSSYYDFGSGIVVPETGVALQNRGSCFSLEETHPNCLAPHKRPYHTIIPGFVTDGLDRPLGPLGVMGGFMQPQGHVQLMMNLFDFNMNVQSAIDAPRWQWMNGKSLLLEDHIPEEIYYELTKRGHEAVFSDRFYDFGRAQIIFKQKDHIYVGGTESRADGMVLAH